MIHSAHGKQARQEEYTQEKIRRQEDEPLEETYSAEEAGALRDTFRKLTGGNPSGRRAHPGGPVGNRPRASRRYASGTIVAASDVVERRRGYSC
jgi:hypothetical protein